MRFFAGAAALLLAGCGGPRFTFQPHPALDQPGTRYTAAVAPTQNQIAGLREFDGYPATNLTRLRDLRPAALTRYVEEELAGSGLFAGVVRSGQASADVLVRPLVLEAWNHASGPTNDAYVLALEFDVENGSQALLRKTYKRQWKLPVWSDSGRALKENLLSILDEFRHDLAEALASP